MTNGGLADHLSAIMGVEITNYAVAGDDSLATMGLAKSQRLESILPGADILVFSSGGDDIAGDQFKIWLNQNVDGNIANAVNYFRLNSAFDLTIADYEDLIAIRDAIAPNCLIVSHSYDFPTASMLGVGVLGVFGPWLKPGLEYCGWTNPADQVEIVKMVMLEFQKRMAVFAETNINHLHVNTQGTLSDVDWQNEIHPNDGGWTKIAIVIYNALIPLMDGLLQKKCASKPALPA